MSAFAALGLTWTALVWLHLRWSTIDPHNPCARPGPGLCLLQAATFSLALLIALLSLRGASDLLRSAPMLLLGMILGPAINPPYHPEKSEGGPLARKLISLRMQAGGMIGKAILVALLSVPLGWVGVAHAPFLAPAFLAVLFSVAKLPVAAVFEQSEEPAFAAAYAQAAPTGISGVAWRGILSLIAWLCLAYPLFAAFPHPAHPAAALAVGLFIRALI